MTDHFTNELRLQLRAAAMREERRGRLARGLAYARYAAPRPPAVAAAALAAVLVALVVAFAALRQGDEPVATPRVVATVGLAESLGSIVPGFGAAWVVDTADGRVLRVDPRSRQVRARIPVSEDALVSAGAGAVWALAPPPSPGRPARLLRIDPDTNRVTARTAVRRPGGGAFNAADVLVLGGAVWVVGGEGAIRVDPATGRAERFVAIRREEPYPLWITGDDDGVWVLTRDQRLDRYDLRTGRLADELPVLLPGAVAVTPTPAGPVLVSGEGDLALVGRADGRIAWQHALGPSQPGPLPVGDTLWVHASGASGGRDRLVEIDARSGAVRSSTTLPEFGAAGAAAIGGELWITTQRGDVMVVRR